MQNSKSKFKIQNLCFFITVFCFLFLISSFVDAVVLYLEPNSNNYYQGDVFVVDIRIDAENECINTVKVDIGFPSVLLEAVDFSQGNSILSIFLEAPKIQKDPGFISFSGGIPGGYCGLIPGDPGKSNLLGKIIFKVKDVGEQFSDISDDATVDFLNTSQVLLNDGLGTSVELETRGAEFTILPRPFDVAQGKDEWQKELAGDKIPPEDFKIEITQDPSIFEGKYFITFSTTDKQTGIDYYEVKEGEKDWGITGSPYLLEDQSLESIIKVKAVDKAGNERIAEYTPPKLFPYWIIILILVVAGAIWWIVRKFKFKNEKF